MAAECTLFVVVSCSVDWQCCIMVQYSIKLFSPKWQGKHGNYDNYVMERCIHKGIFMCTSILLNDLNVTFYQLW